MDTLSLASVTQSAARWLLCAALQTCGLSALAQTLPLAATDWPPFEFADAQGMATGADTEVIQAAFERMQLSASIRIQPWARVEQQGAKGEFAAIYSVIKTPERMQNFVFSDPISSSKMVFFKRKSQALQWQSLADLSAYTVGISAGFAYPEVFTQAVQAKQFKAVVPSYGASADLSSLKGLQRGVVDVVICELSVCQYLIKTHATDLTGIDHMPTLIGTELPMYLAFSKNWPRAEALAHEFNLALAKVTSSGARKKIYKKYGMQSE
ncbi:substrate-binding periplasmic protein [Rhodoferax aquaticus]|nr:transporter substrate-binding domain-containing protein [Rhodoferax aquaticus]